MALFAAAILLTTGTLFFTLFIRRQDIPVAPPPSPTAHLEERRARIYENLRDLQFEYRLGKLSDEDYQKTKQSLQRELATTLAEIDAISGQQPAPVVEKLKVDPTTCKHCGTKFAQPMRYCGACGKAMA
jgi:hypothetical protein